MQKQKTMKNLLNKMKVALPIICYLGIALLFYSCNKTNHITDDCGCNSETLSTVPNDNIQVPIEEQKSGLLFFKHPENIDGFYDDEQYNNRFWIVQEGIPCRSCHRVLIVCNENLLGTEYNYLKQQGINDSIRIKFIGNVKRLCIPAFLPTAYDYKEIVLSSIERQ